MLGGWLYAYELPISSLLPTTRRSDSPDEVMRRKNLIKVKRERTLSLKQIEESRAKAARVREKLTREGLRGSTGTERGREDEGGAGEDEATAAKRRKVVIEVKEQGSEVEGQSSEVNDENRQPRSGEEEREGPDEGGGVAGRGDMETRQLEDSDEISNVQNASIEGETYIFAVHRRMVCGWCVYKTRLVVSPPSRSSLFSPVCCSPI